MFNDESNIVIKEEPIEYQPSGCISESCDETFSNVNWDAHQEGCKYFCSACGQNFDTKIGLISHGKWPNSCDDSVLESHFKTDYKAGTQLTVNLSKISSKKILGTESVIEQTTFKCINSDPLSDGKRFVDEKNGANTQLAAYHMQVEILSFAKNKKRKKDRRLRNRDDTKSHECKICRKLFAKPQYLKAHLKIHTAIKPYPCDKCNRRFSKKVALENHSRIHSGLHPYNCDKCGKPFLIYGQLRRHSRLHFAEELYKCSHCNLEFLYENNFKYHLRVHATDKYFQCEGNGQDFSIKNNRDSRLSLQNTKLYECNDCGQCFLLKCDLVKHTKCHIREKILSVIF